MEVEPIASVEKNDYALLGDIKPSVVDGDFTGGMSHLGTISREIGTGDHAKDSFIWMVLKYCFYTGILFSVCMFLAYFHFVFDKDDSGKIEIIAALKDIWAIFTPILTLALGYAFGKKDSKN